MTIEPINNYQSIIQKLYFFRRLNLCWLTRSLFILRRKVGTGETLGTAEEDVWAITLGTVEEDVWAITLGTAEEDVWAITLGTAEEDVWPITLGTAEEDVWAITLGTAEEYLLPGLGGVDAVVLSLGTSS